MDIDYIFKGSTSSRNSLSQKSGLETQGVSESKHTSSLREVDTGQKEFSNSKIKDMLELLCDESVCLISGIIVLNVAFELI